MQNLNYNEQYRQSTLMTQSTQLSFFFKKLIIIALTTKIIVDFDNRNFYRNQKNDRQIQNDNRNRDDYNDKKKYRQIYQSIYRQIY